MEVFKGTEDLGWEKRGELPSEVTFYYLKIIFKNHARRTLIKESAKRPRVNMMLLTSGLLFLSNGVMDYAIFVDFSFYYYFSNYILQIIQTFFGIFFTIMSVSWPIVCKVMI